MARVPARAPDGCVVPTSPLSRIVRTFLDEWARDRPPTGGRFAAGGTTTEVSTVRASEWLSSETGIPESAIRKIVECRYENTALRTADLIVTALNMPGVFSGENPEIPIRPNPAATPAARAECCGGSS